eukprot:TRINITY_DN1305_c0_g1_i1.p1 TRINITY_DN1305_c0_g1~~TRINITY_DN1305_c0_g1_i1.p1  ORF type:complete len:187 (+),score=52.34 TRINITY_DN1305_c0_g1_i1:78-638(+)
MTEKIGSEKKEEGDIEECANLIVNMVDFFSNHDNANNGTIQNNTNNNNNNTNKTTQSKQTKKRNRSENNNTNTTKKTKETTKKTKIIEKKPKRNQKNKNKEENTDDNDEDNDEEGQCPICSKDYRRENMIGCYKCQLWIHIECDNISPKELSSVQANIEYMCPNCRQEEDSKWIVVHSKDENNSNN